MAGADRPDRARAAERTSRVAGADRTPRRARAAPSPGGDLRRLNVAMLCAGLAGFGLLYSTQALLPALGEQFAIGPAAAALTVSLTTGALALGVLPLSALADSRGRPTVMRAGLVVAVLATALGAAAPSYGVLLGTRLVVGLALAGVVAVAMGHLGDEVDPQVVGGVMGLYVSGNTLGGVLGRIVPAGVQDLDVAGLTGWRTALLAAALVAGVATTAFVLLLPPARRFSPSPTGLANRVGAVRRHLAEPGIRRLCLVAMLLMGGFVATYNYLTYRLESAPFDLPRSVTGLVFLAYLAGTVSSTVAGRLADRVGRRRVLLGSIGLALAGLALTLPDVLPLVIAGLVVFTTGFFGAHSVASGWVSRRADGDRAQASALYLMSYYAGSTVGGAALGLAWSGGGWPATAASVAVLYLLALPLAGGVREHG